jgi:hypothetical protein
MVILDNIVGEYIFRLTEELVTSAFGHVDMCILGDNCVVPLYHGVHTPNLSIHFSSPLHFWIWDSTRNDKKYCHRGDHNSMVLNVAVRNKDCSKVDKVCNPKHLSVSDLRRVCVWSYLVWSLTAECVLCGLTKQLVMNIVECVATSCEHRGALTNLIVHYKQCSTVSCLLCSQVQRRLAERTATNQTTTQHLI